MDGALAFADTAAFEAWLAENHATSVEVWVAIAKKASGIPSITSDGANDVVLCFGWMGGLRKAGDDQHFLQRYSPRAARSTWSQVNVARVGELSEAGRMRPSGQAEVDRAKADGRWDAAYASQATYEVPDDVDEEWLRGLGRTERYLAVLPVLRARTAAAREKAITQLRDRTSGPAL